MDRRIALGILWITLLGCKATSPWHPKSEPIRVADRLMVPRPQSHSTPSMEHRSAIDRSPSAATEVVQASSIVEALSSDPVDSLSDSISDGSFESIATSESTQSIDLPTALALTTGQNPRIQMARERIREATAQWERASLIKLPSIRAGVNYNKHEGRIQDVAGQLIETSRGSFYSGLGANAVGAGSPAVPGVVAQFHLADAIFAPRIAEQTTAVRRWGAKSTENDQLLEAALAYTELLRAEQQLAASQEILQRYNDLVRIAGNFAESGEGLESDFERAKTELAMREIHHLRFEEQTEIASARLAQVIRWNHELRLTPSDQHLVPLELTDNDQTPRSLIATALTQRPELAQSKHLVCEAVERYRREEKAPLVPSVMFATSYGGLGGGLGSNLANYGDRLDFDAVAFWEVRQLGLGDRVARREASSRVEQARLAQLQMMDQVARDVTEAHAQAKSCKKQMILAEQAVLLAESSFQKNWDRTQNAKGLPVEVLQSIDAWSTARMEYIASVSNYNMAQFRLQHAIGWPISSPSASVE